MNRLNWKQWFLDWWLLLVPAVFALGAITAYSIIFRSMPATENPAAWGTFGDFIGGLMNPLVSVLTLFVAISVWKLQKAELELTRNEMAQTKAAMEDQAKTAEQQRREQRFFDLLTLYQSTLQTISFEERATNLSSRLLDIKNSSMPSSVTRNGKAAFRVLTSSWASPIRSLSPIFNTAGVNEAAAPIPSDEDIVKEWDEHSPLLDHYFRTVFTLLREAEPILKNDHFRFIKLFRAQLSRDEVNLIAVNLLYDHEGEKMRTLVSQYGLLKHMPKNPLREIAKRDLTSLSFGRQWATNHLLASPKGTDAP
ncbi:MAG: putative phage abortive infection protein [Rhodoferax sp.]|nr:putative phage abortive infection protein [Rhodoferax sp.]